MYSVHPKRLIEYFRYSWERRHQTWPLVNNEENTPSGRRYCHDKKRKTLRRYIAQIRAYRKLQGFKGQWCDQCKKTTTHYLYAYLYQRDWAKFICLDCNHGGD